ncbi:hypothetical protein MKW98_019847 [Papaver atlanticum]|uniref:Uncharacterized protein n=1 Tax=Papaver atlanticum TaxID=357466 RepID=A0AAD4S0S6_9MAGN|nr:hypothetical protein MKW98_019847 [Papaver atlanticum]
MLRSTTAEDGVADFIKNGSCQLPLPSDNVAVNNLELQEASERGSRINFAGVSSKLIKELGELLKAIAR